MKVWTVNKIHSPHVSHEFEVLAIFSSPEKADAYKVQSDKWRADRIAEDKYEYDPNQRYGYGHEVQEWELDEEFPTPTVGPDAR